MHRDGGSRAGCRVGLQFVSPSVWEMFYFGKIIYLSLLDK